MSNLSSSFKAKPGKLYIIATPIGNLEDITIRAIGILQTCDIIACENINKSKRLLLYYGITAQLTTYREQNECEKAIELADKINSGNSVAVISEAGTPAISDPGFRLVRECRHRQLPVIPLPGANAAVSALSISGLPSDGFLFAGFLPPRKSARVKFFAKYLDFEYSIIYYESVHRIDKFIDDLISVVGKERVICVARELTKTFESINVGSVMYVKEKLQSQATKGEYVVIVSKEGFKL